VTPQVNIPQMQVAVEEQPRMAGAVAIGLYQRSTGLRYTK